MSKLTATRCACRLGMGRAKHGIRSRKCQGRVGRMKIVGLDTWTVSVPYLHDEISSRVARSGVTDTIVRLTADNGLIGWGESCSGPDAASIEQAVQAARPFVIGRDPWQSEAIARDFFRTGLWDLRAPSGNFAFAGIDQALWDLCGKECGQPLYRLFGGSLRDEVDTFTTWPAAPRRKSSAR